MSLSDAALTIATTIMNQLGGKKFTAMTGANNHVFDDKTNTLSFRLPSRFAKDGINYVSITLTPMDDYTVKFKKIWGTKVKDIKEIKTVYCDMLQEVFTETTGLYTRL